MGSIAPLQWEAIINVPIGAVAAVAAFHVVLARQGCGGGVARLFRRGHVPDYMKVPVLVAVLLAAFALSDHALSESGLLAVTMMGLVIAGSMWVVLTASWMRQSHAGR
ncbi:hypothetical protein [Defluviimonas sp. WL0002]|uniref:hypothetical protein n=1 Tax=Albidovulum marisflavi TaxID=2984159 RepID=UPI0029824683|nr:hypothetical protein [Defluviimonas sp. WL0002]